MDPVLPVVAVHALAGAVALGSLAVPLATRKGSPRHRSVGRVYAWAMAVVVGAALVACALRAAWTPGRADGALFLGMLAVQAGAHTAAGVSVLRGGTRADGAVAAACGLAGVVGGARGLWLGDPLLGGFGALTALLGVRLARLAAAPPTGPSERIVAHLVAMGVAGIGTVTAFVVVNLGHLPSLGPVPSWVPWALPSLLGTPAIRRWSRRWAQGQRTFWG